MNTIAEKTKTIIADTLGIETSAITTDTDLYKDLAVDSLDVVELVSILEKEFNVSIPDEKIERMTRVRHFIEHFEKVKPIPEGYLFGAQAA